MERTRQGAKRNENSCTTQEIGAQGHEVSIGGAALHCGCGPDLKQGWINIDVFEPNADLRLDLRRTLPFKDGSTIAIYSEHFFEHLEYPEETGMFLAESSARLAAGWQLSRRRPRRRMANPGLCNR